MIILYYLFGIITGLQREKETEINNAVEIWKKKFDGNLRGLKKTDDEFEKHFIQEKCVSKVYKYNVRKNEGT